MHLQNSQASLYIRLVHHNLAVKASRAQKCRVQNIRPVGGRDDDDAFVGSKTVHLHQHLVQGLLPLIMAAPQACATLASHRINLIDEHDARSMLLGLVKQITDTGSTHAHEHLHKVRTADGEKRHPCLTGNRLGQQGLACTRRAEKQHALGDFGAQLVELLRLLQKLHNLLQLLLCLISTCHIGKMHLDLVAAAHLGTAPAKGHHLAAAPLGLVHKVEPQGCQENNRQQGRKQG